MKKGLIFYTWVHGCYVARDLTSELSFSENFKTKEDAIDYLFDKGLEIEDIEFDLSNEPKKEDDSDKKVRYQYTTSNSRMIDIKKAAAIRGLKINEFIDMLFDDFSNFNDIE